MQKAVQPWVRPSVRTIQAPHHTYNSRHSIIFENPFSRFPSKNRTVYVPRKRENLRFVVVEGVISPTRKQHTKHQQRALFVKRVDKADLDILWEKKMQVRDWLQNFFMSTHTLSEVRHFMAWQNLSWWKLHRVTATKWIQPKENKEERKLFREEKQVTTRKTVSSRAEKNENQQVLQLLSNSSDYLPNIHTHRAGGPASGG